ncbi:MAG: tRNA 2-thiouridine(34) synthase MnmA [Eubacteriales bacterium]|nr:tRNA 2-thiouridine(34) synthase MnmA [Eubacteriales bacterium]
MKAMVGMSGGVDSSVAAWMVLQEGLECLGGTLRLHSFGCGGEDGVRDAAAVARRMGIAHYVFDFQDLFREQVILPFARAYAQGLTPNPCIRCNQYLKFGAMLQTALDLECEYVVTGHYARIRRENGRYLLYRAADRAKDQSYFLAGLTQHQLAHTKFPLGELTKPQVRDIAQAQGFVTAGKRDSQDICFIPDGDYAAFLARLTGEAAPAGDFLDREGNVVGRHRGAVCYTVGQRRGLGLAMGEPVYVCGKDMAANTVTVGPNEALFSAALRAGDWNWYPFPALTEPMEVTAKIRHSQFDREATVYPAAEGFARVEFKEPQRAISPGQAVVLYQGDMVVGGGTITEAL